MQEVLKKRSEMDPAYEWDLAKLFADDQSWEKAFASLEEGVEKAERRRDD